ncbi:HU family DNA-binding protein [Clostridium sardiniense]|uniref:HU family DNA-binding protein n=1 Tax=Clostridium sardiniense TaxID=29369 RepID=UPI0019583997|nr:HU family DNA-binding protein [Clostridium sardiniense]MBM7835755.1 DNA-binding protein HU-beta [Clostridium sardiniense]
MNKKELIGRMAEKSGSTKKETEVALKAFVESVEEALENGERVQLVGFGTFETRERAAREGHNPLTGEKMHIEAKKAPAFKASKTLKEKVNK